MRKWYPWLLVGAAVGFSIAVFNRLPDRIPTHWNVRGVVNGWTPRTFGAFLLPAMMALIAVIVPWLPNLDPRKANYEKFRPTYDLVVNGVITFMAVLHVAMLGAGLGWPVRMERITPVMVGGLFVLLGNVLPRARPNWMFGIRTPWTMSNDRVWERTHRLGGYVFVGAGIVLMAVSVAPAALVTPVMVPTVTLAVLVPLVYSYVIWKREEAAK